MQNKPIDESRIRKYEPYSQNGKRLYNWMLEYHRKNYETLGIVFFPREQLINLFEKVGITKTSAIAALREIEMVCGCSAFWDSSEKTMKYCVFEMSPEEKIKMIEDEVWFERL